MTYPGIYNGDPRTRLVAAAYRLSKGEEPALETGQQVAVNAKAQELFESNFSDCTPAQKISTIEYILTGLLEQGPEHKKLAKIDYSLHKGAFETAKKIFGSLSPETAEKIRTKARELRRGVEDPEDWWLATGVAKLVLSDMGGNTDRYKDPVTPLPPRSICVMRTLGRQHDYGFDPSFTEDGHYRLLQPPVSFKQILLDWLSFFCVLFRAYFSCDSRARNFYKLILASAKAEAVYHEVVKGEQYNIGPLLSEKIFLESIGNLCKQAEVPGCTAPRPFPSEMLTPIHTLNHGQDAVDGFNPKWTHCDLARMSNKGFHRLHFGSEPDASDKVPHYLFAYAIAQSSGELKRACRNLRQSLRETVTDFKCARSFQACQDKLIPQLRAFQKAWEAYMQSHEILAEVNALKSKE